MARRQRGPDPIDTSLAHICRYKRSSPPTLHGGRPDSQFRLQHLRPVWIIARGTQTEKLLMDRQVADHALVVCFIPHVRPRKRTLPSHSTDTNKQWFHRPRWTNYTSLSIPLVDALCIFGVTLPARRQFCLVRLRGKSQQRQYTVQPADTRTVVQKMAHILICSATPLMRLGLLS